MPMNSLTPFLLAGLTACSDYNLNPTSKEDTAALVDTATEDTAYEDTGLEDTAETEDTAPQTVPTVSFKTAIQSCLQLDTDMCEWNVSEGGPDSACVSDAAARNAALKAKVLAKAQEVSGNSALTLTDVENGVVPATVYAYYALDMSRLNGEEAWANYAYINIAFGHVASTFQNMDLPFDSVDEDTLRCMATAYSLETDLEVNEVTWENLETSSHWEEAGGNKPEESTLNIIDFRVFGSGSEIIEINGLQLNATDSNLNFISTENALDDASEDVLTTAQNYTGVVGEDIGQTVTEY